MLKSILKANIFTPNSGGRWGLNVLFWGPPGGAKTAVIEEVCAEYSMPCETLSPSERGEGAFGVVPVPKRAPRCGADDYGDVRALSDRIVELTKKKVPHEEAIVQALKERPDMQLGDDMVLSYPPPDWTQKFEALGRGVIFIDELTSCPPALMPPLMGAFLAKRFGSWTAPKGVRTIAACNPVEQAAAGYDLPLPLANRMGHLDWQMPTVDEHVQYMLRGTSGTGATEQLLAEMDEDAGGESAPAETLRFDAQAEEERVLKVWDNAWATAVGLETAFLQARAGMKNRMPKPGEPAASRAWPSDRTWEMATRAYASSIVHALSEAEQEMFVEAFIGAGVAGEWFTFIKEQDLPNPAKLLDGKEQFKHDGARPDRTVAVLQACVALVSPKGAQRRAERSDAFWQILEKLTTEKADLDLLVPTVHAMIESELHSLKHASKTLAKLNPVLKAAGIKPRGQ